MIFAVVLLLACYVVLINVILRCADGRIGINGTFGIRTATTMTNEQTWRAGHQAAKKPTVTGICLAIAVMIPALSVSEEAWQAVFLLGSCFIVFIAIMVGTTQAKKSANLALAARQE